MDLVECGDLVSVRTPVTNLHWARFAAVSGIPPWNERPCPEHLEDHPVVGITRPDAERFCAWSSEELGSPLRLPTVSEWESIAGGPEGRTFPWGDRFEPDRCNSVEAGFGTTTPVDAFPAGAGAFGTLDHAGNVWEWCADSDDEGWALLKGGSFYDTEWGVRILRTLAAEPTRGTANVGFRPVVA